MHQQRLFDEHDDLEILLELKELSVEQQQKRILLYMAKKLQQILEVEQSNNGFLSQITSLLTPTFPASFTLKETTMALTQPDPGATLQYTATLNPAGSSLGGVIPVWSSSDTANVAITPDATGLVASVVLSAGITVGENVTLTISATDPTTGNVASGTATFTVGAPPPSFPTSFTVTQTA